MPSTLKVDDATKQALDRLQASLTLELGRKPTLQDLLERLARLGWEHRDRLARDLGASWRPLTEAEVVALQQHLHDLHEATARHPPGPPMSAEDRDIYDPDGPA